MIGDTVPITSDSLSLVFTFFFIGLIGGISITFVIMKDKIKRLRING